jgi:glyoxylase-like metal-dependent hydrolase (beta-lactamase superfamily II)
MISEAEYKFWTSDAAKSDALKANAEAVAKKVTPLIEKTAFIKDGSDVAPGIRAIDASGHTPGHLAFNIESGGKRLFAWVDCAHHAVISLQHPEWHLRFDMDKEKGVAVRKRFYDMAATDRIPVIGYHMPFPGAGYVEKSGAAYRWTPVLYQLEL